MNIINILEDDIEKLKKKFDDLILKCKLPEDLEKINQHFLGRKGDLNALMQSFKKLKVEDRIVFGKKINLLKQNLTGIIKQKNEQLILQRHQEQLKNEICDFTLPSADDLVGSMNPISLLQYELEDIFSAMGFSILDGPHVETDYYNFEALNFPPDHPARDMQDTFYLPGNFLLRTQTSNIQIRAMQKLKPPLRVAAPGKVFRAERVDASHSSVFHQIEGLMVGDKISAANMICFLKVLLSEVFKKDVKVRIRPGYFPFVEPGFEMEMNCVICSGEGCAVCKQVGWIEILGCGLVHPAVLKNVNIDYKLYSGFAFGIGIDRLAMMKYSIPDIRSLQGGDLDFAKQFTFDN